MNRTTFMIFMIAIVAIAFIAMWIAWRARARRDSGVLGSAALSGEVLARFDHLQYVSTTPVGDPMGRVAAPGLRYRGPAELTVRRDGVTIDVAGEPPLHLNRAQIDGTAAAGRRAGKAVEAEGLALLRWHSTASTPGGEPDPRELESSFRFSAKDEQLRFAQTIDGLIGSDETDHTQEGPR
ncbi:MAG: hypothetical protein J0H64_09800 [Actinobacteria bacterium]|nr:hypothetical protein [Actinomycetota bacterium]